ncbi:MAG TPA: prephenate dehydratase [Capsulimonadaceae bacterium]|jgi:chorismate mutase/prephenate dehydratase
MGLDDLRIRIDEIDAKLVELLNERAEISVEVGRRKATTPETRWFAPEREREIFKRLEALRSATTCALPNEALHAIYREILSASRALQKPLTIAYWGPAGSYTHMAATSKFGSSSSFSSSKSVLDVFSTVEHQRADYGVIPVENSIEGVVHYTLDSLQLTTLKICAEIYLPIVHNLLTHATDLKDIKRVYTGPQPLAQCRQWLNNNLPDVEYIEVLPTSRAVERATEDPEGAAIASGLASDLYSIPLRVEHIEDDPRNTTRFIVVGQNDPPKTGHDKTSVLFAVKNEPGALARGLRAFEGNEVNLTLITSRPSKHTPWDYVQFVDLQGHTRDEAVVRALAELKEHALFLNVLGSYPEA